MTFAQTCHHLQELLARKARGELDEAAFAAAANALRLTDARGRWWQPDPAGRGWLVWDGAAWSAADPLPAFAYAPATAAAGPSQTSAAANDAAPPTATAPQADWLQTTLASLRGRLLGPSAFLQEMRDTPLPARSRVWWDTLSLLGGAGAGYLWFVYSSVRGMPRLQFLAPVLGRESILDLLPALFLLALPVVAFLARKRLLGPIKALEARFRALSPGMRWLGAGLTAVGLLLLNFDNRLLFSQREGLDCLTPLLMAALPAFLILARRPVDALLRPLASLKRGIPAAVLVGASLAIPFATAFLLYAMGINQYSLLHANLVIGVLLSYAVVRTPEAPAGPGAPSGGVPTASLLVVLLAATGLLLLWAEPGLAHDFLRDPFNFRDGLRTDGAAELLTGVSTSVVSILVNGVEVAKVVIKDVKPVKEGEEAVRSVFMVVVRTVDPTGQIATTLEQLHSDPIYFYAHCEELGKGRFRQGDPTISFTLASGDGWVVVRDLGVKHDERCASVSIAEQLPQGEAPKTVDIDVSAGGEGLIGAQVPLTLVLRRLILEVQ